MFHGLDGKGSKKSKEWHEWGQSLETFEWLVQKFTRPGDWILDPFCGGGTTLIAALKHKRRCITIDIDKEAIELVRCRIEDTFPQLNKPAEPKVVKIALPMKAAG
jgi:DNA modification methylase